MNPAKIHPLLQQHLQTRLSMTGESAKLPIIVHYEEGSSLAVRIGGLERTKRLFQLIPAAAHTATPEAIRALSDYAHVQMIWYDAPMFVPPPPTVRPGGVRIRLADSVPLIGATRAWDAGITGLGVKVGVVDTGIDQSHEDFRDRILYFRDFTGQGQVDGHGHGTHVTGIIGGSGSASSGKYRGVAPGCLLLAFRVLDATGSGATSDVMAGIEDAVRQACRVINLSLGSDGPSDGQDALSIICNEAFKHGVFVVVAAGNEGPGVGTIGSPGAARDVATIGASDDADDIAGFSSRGPTEDGRVKPDLVMPGVDIVSCRASNTYMGEKVGAWYTRASGTSMATPHAAGAAALLLQANPKLTPLELKGILQFTAKNLGCDENTQGKGRGDVYLAYKAALPAPTPPPAPPTPDPDPTPTPTPQPPPLPEGCPTGKVASLFRRR
jgi:subtilisin family serine protease